ncbi:MAG: V-type ATP synthase subunit F [Oscillospiraceae bacterium]|nr:V-type ATP synthase subunit F [Oscillospiraceae bacterium]
MVKESTRTKIGVMGDRQCVTGFLALGLSVYTVEDEVQAAETFRRVMRSEQYAILYITEAIAEMIEQDIARYQSGEAPAVIVIPGSRESRGMGLKALQQAVERAVGTDILAE